MTGIQKTRDGMNLVTGLLIGYATGNDELDRLIKEKGIDQVAPYKGKPAGIIAVMSGIVSDEIKNALMVAQAAERTLRMVDKVEQYAAKGQQMIKSRTRTNDADYIPLDALIVNGKDNPYKHVGNNLKEPAELHGMQGMMMAAQELLNDHVGVIERSISSRTSEAFANTKYADSLKRSAVAGYSKAAEMLEKEIKTIADPAVAANVTKVVGELKDVAKELVKGLAAKPGASVSEFIDNKRGALSMAATSGGNEIMNDSDIKAMEKVLGLLKKAPALPAPATTAAGPKAKPFSR